MRAQYFTITSLADAAGVARTVPMRMIGQGLIEPDADVVLGKTVQPLFSKTRALDILKNLRTSKRRGTAAGGAGSVVPFSAQ